MYSAEVYKTHAKGLIGLQVHGIGKNAGPYQVRWRNLQIRPVTAGSPPAGKPAS